MTFGNTYSCVTITVSKWEEDINIFITQKVPSCQFSHSLSPHPLP